MKYKFDKEKVLNIFNILLFISLIILLFLYLKPNYKLSFNTLIKEPIETPSEWGRNREFPPDYSEDEKLVLTEQKHDYERVTEEDNIVYQKFLELLVSMRSNINTITLVKYKDDCFARPVLLKIKRGEKIKVINSSREKINFGMGEKDNWNIESGKEITITPNFINEQDSQIYWGYSCSTLGLAGYFVIED